MRTVKSTPTGQSQVFAIPCSSLAALVNGTVTYTASAPHRLVTGGKVRVSLSSNLTDSRQTLYGGDFEVAVTSPTVFSYQVSNGGVGVVPTPAGNLVSARQLLPAAEYEPFALVRNNRLQVESSTPDATNYFADTAAHAGLWVDLLALEDCVFNSLDSTTLVGFAAGMPLPKGARIKGVFTNIRLTSGKLLANQ